MPAKICLHFRVLRDLCGEKMGTEFMTIYLAWGQRLIGCIPELRKSGYIDFVAVG